MRGGLPAFAEKLRHAGVPVSNHEMLVTAQSLGFLDFADRESFKWGLASAMCRAPGHLEVFSTLFDLFFAPEANVDMDFDVEATPPELTELDDADLLETIIKALREGR